MGHKSMINWAVAAVIISNVVGLNAHAAGAASWTCSSDKEGLTASYEATMFGQSFTTTQTQSGAQPVVTEYCIDSRTPGKVLLVQRDPNQDMCHKLAGTFPSQLAEFQLSKEEKLKYDIGFQFLGANFLCTRD